MYVLCVAPLRDVDPYRFRAEEVFGDSDFDTAFSSRLNESASLTQPARVEVLANRSEMARISGDISEQVSPKRVFLYDHVGMHMLVALIEVGERTFEKMSIERFEETTTRIFEEVVSRHYRREAMQEPSVRWVNRTLLVPSECLDLKGAYRDPAVPKDWFQQDPSDPVAFGAEAVFWASWGNNMLVHRAKPQFDVAALINSIVHAQFLWCYLTDIERISIGYLELLSSGGKIRNRLVHGVIDLHFELAMESVVRERTRTEAQPQFREAVEAVLRAWEYEEVHGDVDRRLHRLEHIVQGRSELVQRTQSKTMEVTLFVLGALTLVSLAISLIQTAFVEISGSSSGIRPGGAMFEWMRNADATWLVAWSLLISLVVIVTVRLWPKAVDRRERKRGNGIHHR